MTTKSTTFAATITTTTATSTTTTELDWTQNDKVNLISFWSLASKVGIKNKRKQQTNYKK